ncbi:MAG: 2-amino-4-hydroxy-6-hydroxymethyldihydropteridine diphosphokinase [Flavobacteriaceae bacterium]|nr:2-amino-4-hydroxy-6-hydroxymethyldihydropteridine diphosphokinase [Flavobacteriaceae bacterium]
MDSPKLVYIGLGSNLGDRFKTLQEAIDLMHKEVGAVSKISRVYKSEAMGFDGPEFLNAAIQLKTYLPPGKLLKKLQSIEKEFGRKKKSSGEYESRNMDLDLLFYDAEVRSTKRLDIPHPELANRRFVLQPLMDLDAQHVHPVLGKTSEELLLECQDRSPVEPINIWLKNPTKAIDFSAYNYIAIEGNIGAGKTSLARMISREFNAKLILERFADNPFLPKFYEEPQRYAFTLEMSFLADRYQQISDDLSQLDLFKDFIVSDYDVFKSLIFSKITLPEDEFMLYRKLFYQVYKDIAKPDLYVYLYQDTERLQQNIRKRGRQYEQNIDAEYLDKINAGYLEFLRNQSELKVKRIDISELDFVKNRSDYLSILNQIIG